MVLFGSKATGKSAVTESLLEKLSDSNSEDSLLHYAIVKSARCITGRHLFETTVDAVSQALNREDAARRCENLTQLAVELTKMLKEHPRPQGSRFALVFDGIDNQREAPQSLLPALSRLCETVSFYTEPL